MPMRRVRRGTTRGAGSTILWLALAMATACSDASRGAQQPASVAVIDDAGRTVALERPAQRVISMIPAQTEIVTILAGVDAVIARTQFDHDPRLSNLPTIDNALTPSVEWLAAQRPELVIVWPDAQSRDVVQRLSDIGIPAYASRVESIAEIRSMIERLGVLVGERERADSLVRAIDAQLDAVRASVADRPVLRVIYLLSIDPPMVAGPGTYVDDLITIAGGANVFDDVGLWSQVSLEEVVRRAPDVIIHPTSRPAAEVRSNLARRPGWRDLTAVQQQRVYVVDPDLYNRAGVTVGAAARGFAHSIHGVQ